MLGRKMERIVSLCTTLANRWRLFHVAQGVLPLYVSFFTSTEVLVLQIYFNLIGQVDNNGVFKSVFVVHYAAVAVVREHGRPVCSTDFGHFKHDYFDGLNATGLCIRLFVRLILCPCFFAKHSHSAQGCSRWEVANCWKSGLLFLLTKMKAMNCGLSALMC